MFRVYSDIYKYIDRDNRQYDIQLELWIWSYTWNSKYRIGPHTVTYSTTGSKTVSLTITEGASNTETTACVHNCKSDKHCNTYLRQ